MQEKKTLAEAIRQLKEQTGATPAFVSNVESAFFMRGISLDQGAGPFLSGLRESFLAERHMRATMRQAEQLCLELYADYIAVGYTENVSTRLQALTEFLQRFRHTRDDEQAYPMVPGPKTLQ